LPDCCPCIMVEMDHQRAVDRIVSTLRALKPELEARYQVTRVAVFGSYARGGERRQSDLDVLVSFREPPSLIAFIELENVLSASLGVKVDLVMEEALKPNIGRRIREEMVPV
jgi:predicted nucleotidyltransferase